MNPTTTKPIIAAVVLNWNAADETIACVLSLLKSSYSNLQVVIVDNASTDNSVEKLSCHFPKITLLKNTYNAGYSGGNNLGIQWALDIDADYVLVINNDVVVTPELINELLKCIQKDKKIGVVTGKVYYKNDPERIYSGAGKFIRWRCTGVNRGTLFGGSRQHDREQFVNYICGALFLARIEVFKTLGLLDEKFFMYCEDIEFSRRVSSIFLISYTPNAVAYHKSGGGTRWSNYSEVYLYYQTRNRFWVFRGDWLPYRIYVALFTFSITVAKTIVILLSVVMKKNKNLKQLSALWKGLKDGVRYSTFKSDNNKLSKQLIK